MQLNFLTLSLALLLLGCNTGSSVLVGDPEAMARPYPELRTVPERPKDQGAEERDKNVTALNTLATDRWSQNKKIRQDFKLEAERCGVDTKP